MGNSKNLINDDDESNENTAEISLKKVGAGVLAIFGVAIIIVLIFDDATGVGIADDIFIPAAFEMTRQAFQVAF